MAGDVDNVKIILFGAGVAARDTVRRFTRRVEILAVADNAPEKHGTTFMGYPVIPAEDILTRPYDCVVIASMYEREIRQQLLALGVDRSKIDSPPTRDRSGFPSSAGLVWTAALALAGTGLAAFYFLTF